MTSQEEFDRNPILSNLVNRQCCWSFPMQFIYDSYKNEIRVLNILSMLDDDIIIKNGTHKFLEFETI